MKILVTGANGYIGQGIVKKILDNGHEVVAADIGSENIDDRAVVKKCDLFSIKDPYNFFDQPDVLLHLAWRDGFVHYSNTHIEDLPKHYRFIMDMVESGIAKVAVMGSMHEVGFFEGSINENTPCNPITPYGISKNALRELTIMVTKKNNVLFQWLRGYYIVGNSKYGSSVFSKVTAAVEDGKEEFPFTMGQNQYDFIDYTEFCNQVAAVVGQNDYLGVINICSGKPEKLADRMERFLKENAYHITLNYGVYPDRPYDSKAVWGDSSKIESILQTDNFRV